MRTDAPTLRPLKLPPHEVYTLASGLKVHLVVRGSLPLVAIRLLIRGGSASDPPEQLGLSDFMARLLRRGAAGRSPDDIAESVDFVAASLQGFANEENVVVSVSTPTAHLGTMIELLAQVVRAPDFPEAEVELHRRRSLAQLANELDDPGALAERGVARAVWGEHPYGAESQVSSRHLEAITRASLVAAHRDRLGPGVAHLFIVGQFDRDAVLAEVERHLGPWTGGPAVGPVVPSWAGLPGRTDVLIVDKPEQTQVQVRVVAPGVARGHPHHFPLMVMNTVLGGGFTSRLMTEIRVKRGLSYGAGSSFDMLSAAGTFSVSSFTETDRVPQLLEVALGEVARMREAGPTPEEVATVQRYISGLYPARLETNEAVAGALADVVHFGLPERWIAEYRERVAEVTVAAAAAAARDHLFSTDRVIVLVGNAEALKPQVAPWGPITVVTPASLG